MLGVLNVVSREQFQDFLLTRVSEEDTLTPLELGKKLYVNKGCKTCHSLDGEVVLGPSFKGTYGSTRKFNNDTTAVADENYIRESILNPNAKVVSGFQPSVMPAFEGRLNDKQIDGLIAFIKSHK
jgi:cytochrome c oxidase subunit 2